MSVAGAHLDDVTWERLAMGELAVSERSAAAAHIIACAECRAIHSGLRALEDGARAEGLVDAPRAPRRHTAARLVAAAAVIAAAAMVAIIAWPRAPANQHALRGVHDAVLEQAQVSRASGAHEFEWKPLTGAAHYRVEVFAADGRIAWQAEVDAPPATWAADETAAGSYQWRVEALGPGGEVVAHSVILPLTIEPTDPARE